MSVNKKTMVRKKYLRQARLESESLQKQRDALKSKKRAKFTVLAKQRVTKAVQAIELIGKLSNTNHYEYSTSDVLVIAKALTLTTDKIVKAFRNQGKDLSVIDFDN